MKPERMRFLDIWLGKPLCALLSIARACGRLIPRRRIDEPPRKILFIKLIEQGATVLACDAIGRAAELVGKENVYFCVFEDNRAILDLLDLVPSENVFAIRTHGFFCLALDCLRATRRIRRAGIDCVIDMEFFARAPAALTYLTGARRRVGLHRFTSESPYRGNLMTHRVEHNPHISTAAFYRVLVEAAFAPPDQIPLLKAPPAAVGEPPQFVPTQAERGQVQTVLNEAAGREVAAPIVILNPNTSDLIPLRRWPTDRFVELGERMLAEDPKLSIVITGSPAEQAAGAEIARRIDPVRAVSMAGRTSLSELLVLYTLADVLVTNDSGPGHFASITGIDAIVLFGPETPALYGPLGKRSRVIWAGLACSPCVNVYNHRCSPCRDNVCMQAIMVDQVLAGVRSALAARVGAGQ